MTRQYLTQREKFGFGLGDMSSNIVFQAVGNVLLYFYTDVFGLTAAAATLLVAVVRIVDAVIDPPLGAMADRTRSRHGRYRPWLLWLAIHLVYIIGFKHRVTTLLHWAVSFVGRGRSERAATEQQVFGRLALEALPRADAPVLPGDPADAEVSGVAELEARRRTTA